MLVFEGQHKKMHAAQNLRAKYADSVEERPNPSEVYRKAAQLLGQWVIRDGVDSILAQVRSCGGRPYLLAGAVRDAIRSVELNREFQPKDYDIGVACHDRQCLQKVARNFEGHMNRSGGYQIRFGKGLVADLWKLSESAGVKANRCRPSLRNVLRTFVLDVNAVAFDDNRREILDLGCLAAIRSRRIGIVESALLHSHSNFAARATVLKSRLAFDLTTDLEQFVAAFEDRCEMRHQLSKNSV